MDSANNATAIEVLRGYRVLQDGSVQTLAPAPTTVECPETDQEPIDTFSEPTTRELIEHYTALKWGIGLSLVAHELHLTAQKDAVRLDDPSTIESSDYYEEEVPSTSLPLEEYATMVAFIQKDIITHTSESTHLLGAVSRLLNEGLHFHLSPETCAKIGSQAIDYLRAQEKETMRKELHEEIIELNDEGISEEILPHLAQSVSERDRLAQQIVQQNLGLAFFQFNQQRGIPQASTITGIIGLYRSIQRYDPYRQISLSTFSSYFVRQRRQRSYANRTHSVRVPIHTIGSHRAERKNLLTELRRIIEDYEHSSSNLRALLKEPALKKHHLQRRTYQKRPSRFHTGFSPATTLHPTPENASVYLVRLLAIELTYVVETITSTNTSKSTTKNRSRNVLNHRLNLQNAGNPRTTLHELGEIHDVTRERIRQIESKYLKVLMDSLNDEVLRQFVGALLSTTGHTI